MKYQSYPKSEKWRIFEQKLVNVTTVIIKMQVIDW